MFIENAAFKCDHNKYSTSNQNAITAENCSGSDNRTYKDLQQSNKKRKLDFSELVPSKRRALANHFSKVSDMSGVSNVTTDDDEKGHKTFEAKYMTMETMNSEMSKKGVLDGSNHDDPKAMPKDGSEPFNG